MGMVRAFHKSSDEDGGKRVFHNQKECEFGQEIIRNGNRIDGAGVGLTLCERCADIAIRR